MLRRCVWLARPKDLIGTWGYGENFYAVQEKDGKVWYIEKYPEPMNGREGAFGEIKPIGDSKSPQTVDGVFDFKATHHAVLEDGGGEMWFSKEGNTMDSVCKAPGAVKPLRQRAVNIKSFAESLKEKEQSVDEEVRQRRQERIEDHNRNMDALSMFVRINICVGIYAICWFGYMAIPFEDEDAF